MAGRILKHPNKNLFLLLLLSQTTHDVVLLLGAREDARVCDRPASPPRETHQADPKAGAEVERLPLRGKRIRLQLVFPIQRLLYAVASTTSSKISVVSCTLNPSARFTRPDSKVGGISGCQ